jgi:hypothetical protein
MEFRQPTFNLPPPLKTGEAPAGPVVNPCACGDPQGVFGIGPPASKDDNQYYYCFPCWLLRPEKQYSDQQAIKASIQDEE